MLPNGSSKKKQTQQRRANNGIRGKGRGGRGQRGAPRRTKNYRPWRQNPKIVRRRIKRKTVEGLNEKYKGVKSKAILHSQNELFTMDRISMIAMIEAQMVDYSLLTDLFAGNSPYLIFYYMYMCVLRYIKLHGTLLGDTSSLIPIDTSKVSLAIPKSLGKWLQGLGVYRYLGTFASTQYNFPQNFQPTFQGWGSENVMYADLPGGGGPLDPFLRTGLANWHVLCQLTSTLTKGLNFTQVTVPDQTTIDFYSFLQNQEMIRSISQTIAGLGGSVELSDLSGIAPNASAYAQWNGNATLNSSATPPDDGSWQSIFRCFDPEEAILYNLGQSSSLSTQDFTTSLARQVVNYNTTNATDYPWYLQPFATLVFLAKHNKLVGKGPILGAGGWRFAGQKVHHLFCQAYYQEGSFLTQPLGQAYKTLLANKSQNSSTFDTSMTYFTTMVGLAQTAYQRQITMSEINHINMPSMSTNVQSDNFWPKSVTYLPQVVYTDATINSAKLPPLVSVLISSIGPINSKGRIRVPYCNFNAKSIEVTSEGTTKDSIIGPQLYSAYGYQTKENNVYYGEYLNTYSLLMDTKSGQNPTAFPNVTVFQNGDSSDTVVINQSFVNGRYGLQGDIPTNLGTMVLYPITLTGQIMTAFEQGYLAFSSSINTVNQPINIPVHPSLVGSGAATNVVVTTSYPDVTIEPVQLFTESLDSTPPSGAPMMPSMVPDKVGASINISDEELAKSAIMQPSPENDPSKAPEGAKRKMRRFYNLLNGESIPPEPAVEPNIKAPFSLDVPFSGSWSGVIRNMTETLMAPSSPLKDTLENIKQKGEKMGIFELVGKGKELYTELEHIKQDPLAQAVWKTLMPQIKNLVSQVPPPVVQGKNLGIKGLKNVSPEIAKTVQTHMSRAENGTIENVLKKKEGTHKEGNSWKQNLWSGVKSLAKKGGSMMVEAGKRELARNWENVQDKVLSGEFLTML